MSRGLDSPGFGYATPPSFSGLSRLLFFMEQTVIFNTINFSIPYDTPDNTTATATAVASFLCPSDPNQTNLPPGKGRGKLPAQRRQWHPILVGPSDPWGFNTTLPAPNGPFFSLSNTNIASIIDGTSNTACVQRGRHRRPEQCDRHLADGPLLSSNLPLDSRRVCAMPGFPLDEPVVPRGFHGGCALAPGEHRGTLQPREPSQYPDLYLPSRPDSQHG